MEAERVRSIPGRLLREPLVHFLALGAAIFALSSFVGESEPRGEIVVTRGRIEALAAGFARAWQRPPTEEELAGLVRESVREEAAAREAIALGLDRDDTVVRRRLRQKLEFLAEDQGALVEPGDAELAEFLARHPERFRTEDRYTLRQVALSSERGARLARDAEHLLAGLRAAGPAAQLEGRGDSMLLESDLEDATVSEISSRFGAPFADRLATLPEGDWQGPVGSGFGAHLVLIVERSPGEIPTLDEARERVKSEWIEVRRVEAREAFYRDLLERYAVTIEELEAPAAGGRVAQAN
jgi:hypothetical protein